MNEHKFYELFGEIDPEIVAAADQPVPFRQKRGFKLMLIAAVLAFVLLLTPVAGAFALMAAYRASLPEGGKDQANNELIEDGTPEQGQSPSTGGLLGELFGNVNWGALKESVGKDGNVSWKELLAALKGDKPQPDATGVAFKAVKLDDGTMKITGVTMEGQTVIEIPEQIMGREVSTIGASAFEKNMSITHVTIPDSVIVIESQAFYGCENLITVKMSEKIRSIGYGAFSYCTALTAVNFPYSLKSIDGYAFAYCPNLGEVVIRPTLSEWGENVFSGSLQSVKIMDNVTRIPAGAFTNSCLQEVYIPSSVTTIGDNAFLGSAQLTYVTMSEGLTTIGKAAFNQTNISELIIPSTVTDMYDIDFTGCMNLLTVRFLGNAPALTEYPNHSKLNPNYTVYHSLNASGFSDSEWFGYTCMLSEVATNDFVYKNTNNVVPMYNVIELGDVPSFSGEEGVLVIDSYSEYSQYADILPSARYNKAYFRQYALVMFRVQYSSSESVLGVAGLTAKLYTTGGEYFLGLYPIVMFATPEVCNDDINYTVIALEVKRSDIRTDDVTRVGFVYSYNVNDGGRSCYHQGFLDDGK